MGGGGNGGAAAMGCHFKQVWQGGWGTVHRRCHAAVRSGEGRGGQRGGRAAHVWSAAALAGCARVGDC
jgi:hypothetical protein